MQPKNPFVVGDDLRCGLPRPRASTGDVNSLRKTAALTQSSLSRYSVPIATAQTPHVKVAEVPCAAFNFTKRQPPSTTNVLKLGASGEQAAETCVTEAEAPQVSSTNIKTTDSEAPADQPLQNPRRRRRRWEVPKCSTLGKARIERDLVLYYLKAPACFSLVLLMSARNLAAAQSATSADQNSNEQALGDNGENLLREMIEFNKRALEQGSGRSCTFPEELLAGPSLVFFQPPIVVVPTFAVPLPRVSTQNAPPFEYVIGRSHQTMEHVPATARRWFSRRHCVVQVHVARFGRTGEVFFMLRDLRSANGTFLNGRAVPPGCAVPLYNGDLIGVSMTDTGAFMLGFRFVVESVAERAWRIEGMIEDTCT